MSGELDFIESLRAVATHPAARNLEDDTAVLQLGNETLILTHDAMVEGVHFLPTQDMADVAWKLVATNMSDLAAKGARPVGVLLGHMIGGDDARFVSGLGEALQHYDCALLGGDTVAGSGPCSFGLTAIGTATHTPVPSRSGARAGDAVYITGPVGAAMLGFEALKRGEENGIEAFIRPKALVNEGQLLAPLVSAIMDVSDGLLLDASRMAKASGVTLALDTSRVPIATPENRRADALRWGDDYQLLFTANRDTDLPLLAYRIGELLPRTTTHLLLDGCTPDPEDTLGYQH